MKTGSGCDCMILHYGALYLEAEQVRYRRINALVGYYSFIVQFCIKVI